MPNYSEVGDKIASFKRKTETRSGGMIQRERRVPATATRCLSRG